LEFSWNFQSESYEIYLLWEKCWYFTWNLWVIWEHVGKFLCDNCAGKHREISWRLSSDSSSRRRLSSYFIIIIFFLIRLESTVFPIASSRRSNRCRWRNRDRECLLPLNVPDRYDRGAGYFSNLERKSGVSKGVCMIDCATIDSSIAFSRDARLPSAEKHGV